MNIAKRKVNETKLSWLYQLRQDELDALEKLDVARSTFDPNLQIEALNELQRIITDFVFGEYLVEMGNGQYKIDYTYYAEWRKNRTLRTIHTEIERELKMRNKNV